MSFVASLDPTGVDILVIAGDFGNVLYHDMVPGLLGTLCAKYPHERRDNQYVENLSFEV